MNAITRNDGSDHHGSVGWSTDRCSERAGWLSRPLCARYAFAQFRTLDVCVVGDGRAIERWHWGFGMCAEGQFEVLGAWRAEAATARNLVEDLRTRGVGRIRTVSTHDANGYAASFAGIVFVDEFLGLDAFDTGAVVSRTGFANGCGDRGRRAILSAVSAAERLHIAFERAIHRRATFARHHAASTFIAQALQRADRDVLEARLPIRRAGSRKGVMPLSSPAIMQIRG